MWQQLIVDLRPEILVRVALALLAGVVLGVEREMHGRAAGLRTTLLVCLSSCMAMILSDSFYRSSLAAIGSTPAWHPDPARLAAGALSGMGFLGAGVIIHQSAHIIRGVTTAATLWAATVLGLAFGAGALGVGLLGLVAAAVILYLLPRAESLIEDDWYSDFSVQLDVNVSPLDTVMRELETFPLKVKGIDIQTSRQRPEQQVLFHLKHRKSDQLRFPVEVSQRIGKLPGVLETHWHA